MSSTTILSLSHVTKYFKDVRVLNDVSFDITEGEFVSLLGPSGCGKTTTLRIIAGFEQEHTGSVYLAGRDITHEPPYRRNTGMVFQNYALFPHMTIAENISFGLETRKLDKNIIKEKVKWALDLIRLQGYENRMPKQLSGGQQQRVALARAIAIEPTILLLDEPLSNLDAKLRDEMRIEIREIQKRVGITTVFVTHDQEEALVLSDRVFVMNGGIIVASGTPTEIYSQPNNSFTASFIGRSNAFNGEVIDILGNNIFVIKTYTGLLLKSRGLSNLKLQDKVETYIRFEKISIQCDPNAGDIRDNVVSMQVTMINFLGHINEFICKESDLELRVRRSTDMLTEGPVVGNKVILSWDANDSIAIKN
ncbi:MAG: hypothetical protein A2Y53_02145 [Chloroflexi bacterium RBG_16_47_49]|nr:MAG: hypothetical protein A2Y53_02145 [Chloroflexi bacterium RBG_16_47_49]